MRSIPRPQPYTTWQTTFDPLLTPGVRNYWKSHNLKAINDAVIDLIDEYGRRLPTEDTEIFFAKVGGAINRVPAQHTPYPHRDTEFVMNVHARWSNPQDDQRCMTWARDFFEAIEPHATGGVYVNFIPSDGNRVANAYGSNMTRLSQIKRQYDPDNLFRINQNIKVRQAKVHAPSAAHP